MYIFSSYEPELFPGLIYRMVKPRIVLLIFVSGKVVLTGKRKIICCSDSFFQFVVLVCLFFKSLFWVFILALHQYFVLLFNSGIVEFIIIFHICVVNCWCNMIFLTPSWYCQFTAFGGWNKTAFLLMCI